MLLERYSELIRNLPYLDQAFETKRSTWLRHSSDKKFNKYYTRVFKNETIKLSRRELFKRCEGDFFEAIVSIVFWGYPRNMRGNSFNSVLISIPKLEKALPLSKELTKDQFYSLCQSIKGTGIGMSTLTKFLYFFRYKLEGFNCLILDQRILDVLKDKQFSEMTALAKINDYNKIECYVDYLKEMANNSKAYNFETDQLELFLFHFGKNLKNTSI